MTNRYGVQYIHINIIIMEYILSALEGVTVTFAVFIYLTGNITKLYFSNFNSIRDLIEIK